MKFNSACILLTTTLLPLSTLWLTAADATVTTTTTTTTTAPAPKYRQPSVGETATIEKSKRNQYLVAGTQAVADGQRLLGDGKYDDAAEKFQFAVDSLTTGGIDAPIYTQATVGLAAAKAGQAEALAKDTKFAEAAKLLQQAIFLQPSNPAYPKDLEELKRQQKVYEQQIHDPEGVVNNPAVSDKFKERVAAVQKLLFQGDAYFKTGQYTQAEDTYAKILILDPYNKTARNKMAYIEGYRSRAAGFRHDEYEQEQFLNVTAPWSEAISPDIVIPPTTGNNGGQSTQRAKIQDKLARIIIDHVNFQKLDINTVIRFLQDKSKELDPDHEGVNFVLRLSLNTSTTPDAATGATPAAPAAPAAPAPVIHREVTITLDNVPLSELLNYITEQTNLQFSVEDYAVYLRPSVDEGETLTVRTFLVPPNFFTGPTIHVTAPTDVSASTVSTLTVNVQQELSSMGINFPVGATAVFLPNSSKLVVRNTPEQLDLIANRIETLSKPQPQVQIEAKVAEFNQDALKALSFNYQVGLDAIGGGLGPFTSFGSQTALRNAGYVGVSQNGGLSPNSIDTLIQSSAGAVGSSGTETFPIAGTVNTTGTGAPIQLNPVVPNAPNELVFGAVINGTGMAAIIDAIHNINGASLLTAPSVTTQSGLRATIEIIQEFPYPTTFEQPKLGDARVVYSSGQFAEQPAQPPSLLNPLGTPARAAQPLQFALPPTPGGFQTANVGVTLIVKPTTYPDQRIDLDLTGDGGQGGIQVTDFDGFINYGVPITARLVDTGPPTILTPGNIVQPVFNLRSIATNLQVLDGQTAVLGGLIREDTQEINDKVPVLGDLPLVGRLFQSKVSERVKRNLMIFVTARLIRSNGKPQYIKTLTPETQESLPEPDQALPQVSQQAALPPLPAN